MSTASVVINGVLTAIGFAVPQAAPLIAIAMKLEPYAETALPILKDALSEGPAAFAAAKAKAPQFFGHLTELAAAIKGTAPTEQEVASLAAGIIGVDPPGWTHDETTRWWDKATGAS